MKAVLRLLVKYVDLKGLIKELVCELADEAFLRRLGYKLKFKELQRSEYELLWQHSGDPFLTEHGVLSRAVIDAIQSVQGISTELSTAGGTSDGRFISPWGKPGSNQVSVIELGPTNASIHKVNECIALAELEPLARIYQRIMETLLSS